MKHDSTCAILHIACFLLFAGIFAASARATDDQQLFDQARQSYYNLRREGLTEFRCKVTLDWEAILDAFKAEPATKQALLPILKKTHFEVLVGPNGAAIVSHQFDMAPPNEDVAKRIQVMSGGVEQMITGFFQTWSQFMINSFFPEREEKYELTEEDQKFHLTSKQGATEVFLSFGHDFSLDEMRVKTADFDGTVRPKLVRSDKGFVLSSYTGTFKPSSGSSQEMAVSIEYSTIENLTLPDMVTFSVTSPNGSVQFPLKFGDYRLTKK
jgi:hypothetical protein